MIVRIGWLVLLICACGDEHRRPDVARDAGRVDAGRVPDAGGGTDASTDPCGAVDCAALDDGCRVGVCDRETGSCEAEPRADGTGCDDADACTTGDACSVGSCEGTTIDCSTLDGACVTGACDATTGACETMPVAEGTACDDGDRCTTDDACAAGTCGGAPLDCSSMSDGCNAATCDASTGACVRAPLADGRPCDDGARCTTVDRCSAGVCAGTDVDCSYLDDGCAEGACDSETGLCGATPLADGLACDDESTCTTADRCAAGRCTGAPVSSPECSVVPVSFPVAGDTRVASAGVYFWRLGDYVEGSRTTTLGSVGRLDMNLVLELNSLTCDTQDIEVRVNGALVGTVAIAGGDSVIARSFTFPAISGPTYTLGYHTAREVGSGCGSTGYANTGSTVTLRP
jgi:hypothetical protein